MIIEQPDLLLPSAEAVKQHVQIEADYEKLRPLIEQAQNDVLAEYITAGEVEATVAIFIGTNEIEQSERKQGIYLMQSFCANYAVFKALSVNLLSVGADNITVRQSEEAKLPPEWVINKAQQTYLQAAYSALNRLLAHLQANAAIYTIYVADADANARKSLFLSTPKLFSRYYSAVDARVFELLVNNQLIIQEQIATLLGDVYAPLIAAMLADTLTTDQQNLLKQIRPYQALLTVIDYLQKGHVRFDETGLHFYDSYTANSFQSKKSVTTDQIDKQISKLQAQAAMYLSNLRALITPDTPPVYIDNTQLDNSIFI